MELVKQIFRFGIVGGICFFVDYGIMVFLVEKMGVPYLLASGISFTIALIVTYVLNMRFVFDARTDHNAVFIIFAIMSVIGLGINQVIMKVMVEKVGSVYRLAKIVATAVVMVYNFITRKLLIESK